MPLLPQEGKRYFDVFCLLLPVIIFHRYILKQCIVSVWGVVYKVSSCLIFFTCKLHILVNIMFGQVVHTYACSYSLFIFIEIKFHRITNIIYFFVNGYVGLFTCVFSVKET